MKQDYEIWNTLHDGAMKNLSGSLPGDIRIQITIPLTNYLKNSPDKIFVTLKNCTLFEYEQHWSKDEIRHYSSIEDLEGIQPGLMAMSCDEKSDHLEINELCGVIRTKYDSAELSLENGDPLTFEELDAASKDFWDDFRKRKNT